MRERWEGAGEETKTVLYEHQRTAGYSFIQSIDDMKNINIISSPIFLSILFPMHRSSRSHLISSFALLFYAIYEVSPKKNIKKKNSRYTYEYSYIQPLPPPPLPPPSSLTLSSAFLFLSLMPSEPSQTEPSRAEPAR